MGCGASTAAQPSKSSTRLGQASSITPQSQGGANPPAELSTSGCHQGGEVFIGSTAYRVQYVSSKGLLDLRAGDEVLYSVDPATVTIAATAGSTVELDGARFTVQYVTSSGTLDLKSADGDVRYGVDATTVKVVQGSAPPPPAETPEPAADKANVAAATPSATELVVSSARIQLLGEPLSKVMGSGASLYRCLLDGDAEERAAKLLPISTMEGQREELSSEMLAELRLCRELRHSGIVRFDLLAECVEVGGARYHAIVMEFVPVTLDELIAARAMAQPPRPFGARRLAALIGSLAATLHHLHAECGTAIVHGDLKPQNLCFPAGALEQDAADDDDSDLGLKLIDFGAACRSAEPMGPEFSGTIVTMPPESFACEHYHAPADIWAVGILLQWALLLRDPMGEKLIPEWEACVSAAPAALPVFSEPTGGERAWGTALEPLAALARRCLAHDAGDRPTAQQVAATCREIAAGAH